MVAAGLLFRRAWRRRSWLSQVSIVGTVAFAASLILALSWASDVDVDSLQVLVAAAYFLFGVFVAFALDSARTRMAKVNDLLKVDEANLLALHEFAHLFSDGVATRMRTLIDLHLQDQIDYRLVDFGRSTESHLALMKYVAEVASNDNLGKTPVREQMLALIVQTNANRTQVETSTRHSLSKAEWICILSLFGLLAFTLPFFDGGTVLGAVVVSLLTATLAVFVAILWNVDHLRWQEESWIWEPLDRLFRNLGLLPYYPLIALQEKRALPIGTVRAADYPHPYPDVSDKQVRVIDWPTDL